MIPALFVSHGSPMIALDTEGDFARALAMFGAKNRPRAVVVVSAHWQTSEVRVTASPQLIYDFSGFPRELNAIEYPCRGDDELAGAIAATLGGQVEERGLDHGAWVPLRFLFPEGDVPVVQLSLLRASHEELRAVGEALSALDDVLLVGSGGIVHNLRLLHWNDKKAPVDAWAREYDEWAWANVGPDFAHEKGPRAELAAPTSEHMDPIYVVLGAASGEKESVFEGFEYGNLSMRSFSTRRGSGR